MKAGGEVDRLCRGELPARYFVGRVELQDELIATLMGKHQSVWLSGARDVGKTTLARSVAERIRASGGKVIEVSAGAARSFEQVCECLALAGRQGGAQIPTRASTTDQL